MKEVIKKVEDYLEGKPKGITLNGPMGKVTFTEDQLLQIISVCHFQLDKNIDSDRDLINDSWHTALTHRDPNIMKSFGRECMDLGESMKVKKLLDDKWDDLHICEECKEDQKLNGKEVKH